MAPVLPAEAARWFRGRLLPFTWQDRWYCRWLVLGFGRSTVIHRVASIRDEQKFHDIGAACLGRTVCGRLGKLSVPGVLARLGAPRCAQCCKRLGVPRGDGAPFNNGIDA